MKNQKEKNKKNINDLRVAIAAVDVVLFTIIDDSIHTFLLPINRPPFYVDIYGLVGGLISIHESADNAVLRHLSEKAHIQKVSIDQLFTFSDPKRDKRSRSISIAYMALVSPEEFASFKHDKGVWTSLKKLPKLAYDHSKIINVAHERLKAKITYTNTIKNLLSKNFTLSELQHVYEIILQHKFDKRNFRKKMLSIGIIKEIGKQKKTMSRPAQLYTFIKKGIDILPEISTVLVKNK